MKPLAISLGDPAGIGPDLLRLTLDDFPPARIYGHADHRPDRLPDGVSWVEVTGTAVSPGRPSEESGRQAFVAFEAAAAAVSAGDCSGLVTLPLAKEWVARTIPGFRGHTEQCADWWGGDPVMMLTGGDLRVALITIHEPLVRVPDLLTLDRVVTCGRVLRREMSARLGREPELHLLGLNPHAGENGLLGDEETEVLVPALDILVSEGGDWNGPHAADGFFARRRWGDAVLAPYHDQGMIPVKMEARGAGVNITLGLPHPRTSPDHGTAFELAGGDGIDPRSFIAALKACRQPLSVR